MAKLENRRAVYATVSESGHPCEVTYQPNGMVPGYGMLFIGDMLALRHVCGNEDAVSRIHEWGAYITAVNGKPYEDWARPVVD